MICVPGHLSVFSFNGSARGFMLRGPKYMLTQISTGPCGARSRPPLTGGISTGACTLVVAGALTCACDLAHLGSESGVELAYRAIRCASDLDPHPAPTPLNITVSISETRLPYLSRTARIGGETLSGQTFYFNVSPAVSCPVLETGSPCAWTVAANQDKICGQGRAPWPGCHQPLTVRVALPHVIAHPVAGTRRSISATCMESAVCVIPCPSQGDECGPGRARARAGSYG